ncbi:SanA/YdcF family protein [Kushneria marisflavi]|uniref:SanA/YdcF family protein n=1 Tax=Kushneria marisflavi TaxID=157779 RepID=UPI001F286915|nr:ElyC/SanA/YdcF family protein [Kushneria marisflavi]
MAGLLKGMAIVGAMALVLIVVVTVSANYWVWRKTHASITLESEQCAHEPVGLVFGTSYGLRGGGENPWYRARLDLAASLWKSGQVDHLLISGDNHTRYYNEPVRMWRDLRQAQIPDAAMTLDYAGFSTFDTLARSRDVFGVSRVTLISQRWHLPRALFIAQYLGLEARGCATRGRTMFDDRWMWAREILARVQVIADLYILDRHPYFLGPSIVLPTSAQGPGHIIPVYQRVAMPDPVEQALGNLRIRLDAPSAPQPKTPWRVIR